MTRIKKFINVWMAGSIFHDDEMSNPAGFDYYAATKRTGVEVVGRMVNAISLACIDRMSQRGAGQIGASVKGLRSGGMA